MDDNKKRDSPGGGRRRTAVLPVGTRSNQVMFLRMSRILFVCCYCLCSSSTSLSLLVSAFCPTTAFDRPAISSYSFSLRPTATYQRAVTTMLWQQQQQQEQQFTSDVDAKRIISSFALEQEFDPFIKNEHLQTILGSLLRKSVYGRYIPVGSKEPIGNTVQNKKSSTKETTRTNKSASPTGAASTKQEQSRGDDDALSFWDKRERIETPDGDWFHADTKFVTHDDKPSMNDENENDDTPIVLLLHGLQSSSASYTCIDMARAFTEQAGMHCTCLNFRSCSGEPNERLGAYHLGFDDDLRHYITTKFLQEEDKRHGKKQKIYLAGFSLGANVVLKCLGQLGGRAASDFGIAGAFALCAPLDQRKNGIVLHQAGVRSLYVSSLLKSMKQTATDQQGREGFDRLDYERIMKAETITDFDDAFIAPVYGFDSCWDYYDKTSSVHFLSSIAVPTLLLNAEDDPFMDPSVWPTEQSCEFGGPAPLKMIRTRHGGHLGFWFHQVDDKDSRLMSRSGPAGIITTSSEPSWSSWEAARFLKHVEDYK